MKNLFLFLSLTLSTHLMAEEGIKAYKLNCGQITFPDTGFFSDTGEYDGKKAVMDVPCYLIKHPTKGYLMWDTGLSESLINKPHTNVVGAVESLDATIESQLKKINVTLTDITFVSFSHLHADHAGNADLFKNSTWILQQKEFDFATRTPPPIGIDQKYFSTINTVTKKLIDGDYDVFSDGTVRIIFTPGHTRGHQSLMLNFKKAGPVILAGDLYHFNASRWHRRVPIFNSSRAETLASIERVDKLAKTKKAEVVIQHEKANKLAFPVLPVFIE